MENTIRTDSDIHEASELFISDAATDVMPQVQELGTLRIAHTADPSKPKAGTPEDAVSLSEPLEVDDEDPSIFFSV